MKTIDCKGLSCPAPVLKSKEVIENEHPEKLRVIADMLDIVTSMQVADKTINI